jgi:aspartyl/asparaginyl beta-hydroxylase (cupin superfamily)
MYPIKNKIAFINNKVNFLSKIHKIIQINKIIFNNINHHLYYLIKIINKIINKQITNT